MTNYLITKIIKTMDYREMMKYAPKDCQPMVIGTPQEEAAEQIAKKYGKKVDELSEEEKAEAMKLAEKFKNATNDPLDAYRG